ncbi:MAG: DinB family protein [Flavipsychrobacter sp.]
MLKMNVQKADLEMELENTLNDFINTLKLYSAEQLNTVPFEGSWTGGQVAEHIIKSLENFAAVINGNVSDPGRPIDAKCAAIRGMFLDFDTKFNSPQFVLPVAPDHDKKTVVEKLLIIKHEMLPTLSAVDLSKLCTQVEFPGFGYLTRLEWFTFFAVHTQRHTRQLKNIYTAVRQ